jgi:hypothetical protein
VFFRVSSRYTLIQERLIGTRTGTWACWHLLTLLTTRAESFEKFFPARHLVAVEPVSGERILASFSGVARSPVRQQKATISAGLVPLESSFALIFSGWCLK